MNFENENIEFKSQFTEEIYKEVIAFANTDVSIAYIGIDNEGNAAALSDADKEYTRITNGINKDANFDTNRKSLLRHISAEKGLK